ncbi:FliM/FliN family flagellar motor switch protein [Bacillus mexicanus]|uniref:flagellar motor switch protein FliM n=1 Tax=Bacillus mexicanus TaxID=2834415 RepID=UPI003D208988
MEDKTNQGLGVYDFDRPDKFSFENLRSLDSILSIFARNFATDLSGLLRMPAEVEVKKVEQIPFASEYTDKREKDEYVFVVTNLEDKEQIIVQMDVGFLLCVHSKQGGGAFGKIKTVKKNITDFEKLTVEHLIENCLYPPLKEAFKNVWDFSYNIERIETDPQYAKITLPQDMAALVTFDVRVGNEYTQIQFVIPYLSIEMNIENLNTDNVLKNRKIDTPPEQVFYLCDNLLQTKENFEVELGVVELTVEELLQLNLGDTLVLNPIENPVICNFGGEAKFIGKIGSVEGKAGVKIIGMVKEVEGKEEKIEKVKEELLKNETDE